MEGSGKWIIGGLVGILGVAGLFGASGARDLNMYYVGLTFFVAAVIFIFWLIGTTRLDSSTTTTTTRESADRTHATSGLPKRRPEEEF
jgi:hypothetical protein